MLKKQLVMGFSWALMAIAGWCQSPSPEGAPLLDIKRFVIEGDNPLSEQESQALLAPYLGPHNDLASIEAAAAALEKAIRDQGRVFHRVIVPAQKPDSGELKLRVLKFSLAGITVSGNRYFSRENILRSLPAFKAGGSPDIQELGREITLANEHPAKRLTVQFKESAKPDHIDADVVVRDVPAAQTFIGLTGGGRDFDNTLNRNTGYTRLTVGHQRSNLFDLDHALTLAYTTSPDHLDKVSQYGVFYWMPLYGYSTSLSAYWTKSDIDTGSVGVGGVNFAVSGKGEFYGLRATYALPKFHMIAHNISIAIDSRYFASSIGFAGGALPTNSVGSMPVSLRYTVRSDQQWGGVGGNVEYVANVGGGRGNDALAYNTARATASTNWSVVRWDADAQYNFASRWGLNAKLRGQYTNDLLIPGEQFGIGGVASVRGFKEREATGDRGYSANIELTAPAVYAGIVPFGFTDFGRRMHITPVAGVAQQDNVASAGFGARWNWEKGLDVSVTYANVLNGIAGGTPRGHDKVNFSLFYRF
jgi:hemolysin activation/secretion protein